MIQEQLKILLLSDGGSFHTERFYNEMQSQGCNILLASLESGMPDALKLKRRGSVRQFHYRMAVPQIKFIIKSFKPDIISTHFASGYGHIAALANRDHAIPLALNLWGSDILRVPQKSIFHKKKTIFALKKANHVFADSKYLIEAAKKLYDFSKYSVIPWGIEKNVFDLYKSECTLSQPLKIIIPRAHEAVYNNLFIVQSLQTLINSDKIKLTFPVFGSKYESFKESAKKLVGDKINYYEKAPREDFLKFASEHDLFLSASLSDSSPVSLIEAMALGLIPVVMNIDGVKEWITSKNGFIFEHDRASLLQVVTNLLDGTKDFKSLRQQNKNKVEKNALFVHNIAEQIKIFKSLVEKSR